MRFMSAHTIIAVLCIVAAITILSLSSSAQYSPDVLSTESETTTDSLTAKSALVLQNDTAEIVLEKDADTVRPIASVTKLFTAHAANSSTLLDTSVLIEWQDFSTEGGAGSLALGESYTLRGLLFPLLLSSSNDAGTAIMRAFGETAFAAAIQTSLDEAGLGKTRIADGSGLSSQNVSTARELATFLTYLETKDPYILDITTLRSYGGEYRGWVNNNPARTYDSFAGGKHGMTPEAGRTFAGFFEGNDGKMYTVVLLGSSDLQGDLEAIVGAL